MESSNNKRYAWMAYSAICIMAIIWTGIQFNCMNLYAAPVVEEMGISRTAFMTVLSIPGIISAIVSLFFFGTIEEKLGMRRMLLIGGTLNTLAFVSWYFMNSVAMLYLGGALYGFGCSITAYSSVAAGVNRWFKQRTGTLMGIANALGNATGIVFSLVIAAIIATVGWRYSFGLCAVLSAIATATCTLLYKGSPVELGVPAMYEEEACSVTTANDDGAAAKRAAQSDSLPFRETVRTPRLWIFAFGYLLLGMTTYSIMSTLPLFAVDLGLEHLQGQAVSVSLLATAIMMVPLGGICDKKGTVWAMALSSAFVIIAAGLLSVPDLPAIGMFAAAAFSGSAYSICGVAAGTGVKEAFGEVDFGKKLGVCSGSMYIGLALGPALINLVYDTIGTYTLALALFAATAVILTGIFARCTAPKDAPKSFWPFSV